nr:MAG TPA: hypothetical protein [Caudoviricetes sp.]
MVLLAADFFVKKRAAKSTISCQFYRYPIV